MKRIGLVLLSLFLLCSCQKPIQPSKENCLEVCMDDANVLKKDVLNSDIKEENDAYKIVFETSSSHYEYKIGKDGKIQDKKYKALKEKENREEEVQPEPEEKPSEEKKDEISKDAKQRALEAACINMGIDTSAPQNVQVTMEEGQLVVRFDFGEGVTYVTTVDPNSYVATSSYSI